MTKEVKRGYVKWEDENGFHKEPLSDHPDLLADASPREQLYAEEVKRHNALADTHFEQEEKSQDEVIEEALEELKSAPPEVISAASLVEEVPAAAPEEPVVEEDDALRELREKTTA